jgi:hypothetical protein
MSLTRPAADDRGATTKNTAVDTTAIDKLRWRRAVADLVFVLLTIGLFALLALVVRAVERL